MVQGFQPLIQDRHGNLPNVNSGAEVNARARRPRARAEQATPDDVEPDHARPTRTSVHGRETTAETRGTQGESQM